MDMRRCFWIALAVFALVFLAQRFERSDRALRAEVNRFEQELAELKANPPQVANVEQLKAENARLTAENSDLQTRLRQAKEQIVRLNRGDHPQQRVQLASEQTPADPNAPYDPLAFYRRNPELMKRYFPQLYKAQIANQAESQVPPPPADKE
jgi:hypothetical protein